MRIFRPCIIAGYFYPEALFRIKTTDKIICLTFDDGPDPSSTPVLLEILDRYKIKALFFCIGSRAEKYPDLVKRIIEEGHIMGNHTYSHLNGWSTSVKSYTRDVEKASALTSGKWFRPPFGRLRLLQCYRLKQKYKILFWDVMPYDFDDSFPPEDSLRILLKKIRPGSVIVLHDRYRPDISNYVNQFIESAIRKGYRFVLPDQF
ncbi:MAG: hypothetical protein A2X05_16840 [Bacteroidetes bacterium GWE2_41_25]|nr:MAG: hypothetical protein A2X05_16840 [Bacteroidetes bacterium GWE2_41_25]HBQ81438.1 polysaccharide deacetylase family protein [Bacteroidales bacterium]HCU20526.1 polysaccharide deacetylase family protein [Bacteroidales bacterium]